MEKQRTNCTYFLLHASFSIVVYARDTGRPDEHCGVLYYAHLPSSAINPAPKHINPTALATVFMGALSMVLLNMNS